MTHSRLLDIVKAALQANHDTLVFELPRRKFREGKPIRLFGARGGPMAHVVGETPERLQVRVKCMELFYWLEDNPAFLPPESPPSAS